MTNEFVDPNCKVCQGKNKLGVRVQDEITHGDSSFSVPKNIAVPCPICLQRRHEAEIAMMADKCSSDVMTASKDRIVQDNGNIIVTEFAVDENLAKLAKENPHELFQRMLTAFMDEIKTDVYSRAGYKVSKLDNGQIGLTMALTLVDTTKQQTGWLDLDRFDDEVRKQITG